MWPHGEYIIFSNPTGGPEVVARKNSRGSVFSYEDAGKPNHLSYPARSQLGKQTGIFFL